FCPSAGSSDEATPGARQPRGRGVTAAAARGLPRRPLHASRGGRARRQPAGRRATHRALSLRRLSHHPRHQGRGRPRRPAAHSLRPPHVCRRRGAQHAAQSHPLDHGPGLDRARHGDAGARVERAAGAGRGGLSLHPEVIDVMANDGRQRFTRWALTAAILTALALASPAALPQSSVASPPPPSAEGAPASKQLNPLPAAADIHTVAPLADGQWTLPAGDSANTRFSPLKQINSGNVANLKVVSTMADGIPHGWEGQPLVVGDTMYVVTPYPDKLIAIDLKAPHGPVKWIYNPNPDPRSQGVACCDVVNRGAVYADGKIIYNLLDVETVAVDAKTGKQVWRTRLGSIRDGTTMTMAPLAVNDKVFVGNSGNELGTRGWITALNVSDGSIAWRAYSTGTDKDCLIGPDFKPFYAKDRGKDLGITTWPPGQWKIGGGAVWGWISYDPETKLIFYGDGNPGTWDATQRPGANKWSNTIFARNPDTGQAVWAFQEDAHDAW